MDVIKETLQAKIAEVQKKKETNIEQKFEKEVRVEEKR